MSSVPFEIASDSSSIPCVRFGELPAKLVFTHGAGGSLNSDAMVNFATGFATSSSIVCFKGSMNLKSRVKAFGAVIGDKCNHGCSTLGGRSMGARAAVMAATEMTECLVLVSYPLRSDKGQVRDEILLELRPEIQVLFVSGDGDSMCDIAELHAVRQKMKCKTWFVKVRNADHGMNVKPKRGTKSVGEETGKLAARWLESRDAEKTACEIWYDEGNGAVENTGWKNFSAVDQLADGSKEEAKVKGKKVMNEDVKADKKNAAGQEVKVDQKRPANKVAPQQNPSKKRRRSDDRPATPRRSSRLKKTSDE